MSEQIHGNENLEPRTYLWNETMFRLESPTYPAENLRSQLVVNTAEDDSDPSPDTMPADYNLEPDEVLLGTVSDLRNAWQRAKQSPEVQPWLNEWLAPQADKLNNIMGEVVDNRVVLAAATHTQNRSTSYTFAPVYRFGSYYYDGTDPNAAQRLGTHDVRRPIR